MVGRVSEKRDSICIIPGNKNEEADLAQQSCGREGVVGTDCPRLTLPGGGGAAWSDPPLSSVGAGTETQKEVWEGELSLHTLSLRCGDIHVESHSLVRKVFIEHLLCTTLCCRVLGDSSEPTNQKSLSRWSLPSRGADVGDLTRKKAVNIYNISKYMSH